MGKGNGLAIFALLIGFGGLGLGVYSVFILPDTIIANTMLQIPTNPSEIIQIWTKEQPTAYYTSGSYYDVPDMDITISVNTGETVLIMFNGEFTSSVGRLVGGVRLMRDNVEIPSSRREFTIETSGVALMGYSMTTYVLIDNLATGNYEIEVQAFGSSTGGSDRIDDGVLVIYTFI